MTFIDFYTKYALEDASTQPPAITCPVCLRVYEFEWDAIEECWWPGAASWWQRPESSTDFLCSRRCWLAQATDSC